MTLEHQAAFARRIQRDKGYITRLKQAGRLVMSGRLVDVEASIARIQATRGDRFDVSARAESARVAKPAEPAANDADLGPLDLDAIGRRTRIAQMLEKEASARLKAREDQESAGELVRRSAVQKLLADAATVILSAGETLPDRVAPLLVMVADQAKIRAVLADEMERFFAQVSSELRRSGA